MPCFAKKTSCSKELPKVVPCSVRFFVLREAVWVVQFSTFMKQKTQKASIRKENRTEEGSSSCCNRYNHCSFIFSSKSINLLDSRDPGSCLSIARRCWLLFLHRLGILLYNTTPRPSLRREHTSSCTWKHVRIFGCRSSFPSLLPSLLTISLDTDTLAMFFLLFSEYKQSSVGAEAHASVNTNSHRSCSPIIIYSFRLCK